MVGHADPAKRHILIVKSRDNTFYSQTQQGFIDGLKTRGYSTKDTINLNVIALTGDAGKDQQIVQDHLHKGTDLIFTLGTDATQAIFDAHPKSPVLFSMILDPVNLGVVKSLAQPGGTFTGTTLLVAPGKQLDTLQSADPHI